MMFSSSRAAVFAAYLLTMALAQDATRPDPIPTPTATPSDMGMKIYKGCFKSSTPLQDYGSSQYQSSLNCQPICAALGKPVFGLSAGSNCWCGDLIPATADKVDDSECDIGCQGYGSEKCGGVGRFNIYLSGLHNNAQNVDSYVPEVSSSSSPSPTSTGQQEPSEPAQSTAVVTQTQVPPQSSAPPANDNNGGGTNVGAIVGGVVAVVAVLLVAVGIFFFLKRRKDQRAEQSRRSAAMRDFHGRPPGTGASSIADNRLDPTMMQRRQSNGSIADNEDYSRRVLAVTNA